MFEYICKELISDNDQLEFTNFIEHCSNIDNYVYDLQYETEILSIPSLYVCYSDNTIIGLLSACENDNYTLCIYSLISPEFRNNHIFSTLYDMLLKNINQQNNQYQYLEFHLPNDHTNYFHPASIVLNKYNFKFSHKEYLLSYSLSENSSLNSKLNMIQTTSSKLEVFFDESENEFTLWIGENYIGGCMVYLSEDDNNSFATIFDYEIVSNYQGQGFGKIGLYLILEELQYMNYKKAILHVSGLNKKAHNLYISCGFDAKSIINIYINEI